MPCAASKRHGVRGVLLVAVMAVALGAGARVQAEPSVPWTPSAAGRHAVELLVDEAGLDVPTTQWPLPRAAVVRALDALPAALAPPLAAARALLHSEL